ncbi:MAG TPA: sensor histidine kinase [Clostridiaceae bacterium]|nr:sensor histidine kinase [Clostridiaceae bacterium]
MEKTTNALFVQISTSIKTVMDNTVNNLNALAKAPLYSTQLQEELNRNQILSSESIAKMQYSSDIVGTTDNLHHVIALYNRSGNIAYSSAVMSMAYVVRQYYDMWYKAAEKENGGICITGFPGGEKQLVCTVSRLVKSIPQMDTVGLISISVPRSVFDEACAQIQNVNGGVAVVFDAESNVIYSSRVLDMEDTVQQLRQTAQRQSGGDAGFDTGDYIGYYSKGNAGEYSILIYTTREELLANQQQTRRLMTALELLVGVLTVLIILLVTSNTTKPLRKIAQLMVRVQKGDWLVRFNPRYNDEIGILGRNFNQMLDRMNEMTEQLITISTHKKQTEIDALQGQINPHFMYNTLESFRMMAVEKDDFELADLLCSFGKMLRYNITTMNEMTTIRQEIEYLNQYIKIQNTRYTLRFSIEYDVPDEMMEFQVIKLLIQPIVENAIFHGLEMQLNRERKISIAVYRRQALCFIDICDNGIGMSPEKLENIRAVIRMRYSEAKETTHIGLRNVNERTRLYYGEEYGLSVDSKENEGTLVRITLPYQQE